MPYVNLRIVVCLGQSEFVSFYCVWHELDHSSSKKRKLQVDLRLILRVISGICEGKE